MPVSIYFVFAADDDDAAAAATAAVGVGRYVQSAGIMHRDLKPENIAMNENMELRVLDFGMARGVNQTGSGHTGYVVTRHYRAPEVLCFEFDAEKLNYTEGVDSWALGCIIAEQITGQVLFQGSNFIEQLSAIGEKLGRPPQTFVAAIANEDVRSFTVLPVCLTAYLDLEGCLGACPASPSYHSSAARTHAYTSTVLLSSLLSLLSLLSPMP